MSTHVTGISLALAAGAVAIGFALESHAFMIHVLTVIVFIVCLFPAANQRLKQLYWLMTKKRSSRIPDNVDKAKYLAMDCEMVGIGPNGKQSALARVSIVDWDLKVIFDTYVQVMDRVTDYRTHVSGIRKKHLKGPNAMNCRKCRETVAALLQDKVIVGHGLENDFDALNLIHPNDQIRDTSLYRPLQRFDSGKWRSKKLRELVQYYLGVDDFQQGEHDSIHDARAVMELYHIFYHEWEQSVGNEIDN
jgi:RNA exonuclease 4